MVQSLYYRDPDVLESCCPGVRVGETITLTFLTTLLSQGNRREEHRRAVETVYSYCFISLESREEASQASLGLRADLWAGTGVSVFFRDRKPLLD